MTDPIVVPEEARHEVQFTWTDSVGTPIDVTGYLAAFTVREHRGNTDLLSLTQTNGIVLGNANGTFTVSIPATFSTGRGGFRGVAVLDAQASAGSDPQRVAKLDLVVEHKY